jgi:hypothetical protein
MPCTIHLVDVDAVVDLLGSPMLGCIVLWCWWCLPCTYELPQILAGDAATADELGVVYIDGHDLFLAGFGGGCWCCLLVHLSLFKISFRLSKVQPQVSRRIAVVYRLGVACQSCVYRVLPKVPHLDNLNFALTLCLLPNHPLRP